MDIYLFLRNSWKNIWKQKTIWLFSALPLFNQIFNIFRINKETNLPTAIFSLLLVFISFILLISSFVGVPYIAYCLSIDKQVSVQETLSAIKKFSGRVIGCSCLSLILASPLIVWVLSISINNSTHNFEIPNKIFLFLRFFALFNGLWYFSLFGFFANDWGIRQSVKAAWSLYISRFSILAILGIGTTIILMMYSAASAILTVSIQSGFNTASLAQLNIINPAATLSRNLLFALIYDIGYYIISAFSTTAFAFAYLKYSEAKSR